MYCVLHKRYPDGTVRRILYPSVERDARSSPHHDNGVELSTSSYDVAGSTFGVNANETLRRRGSSATEVPDTVNSLLAMVRSPELRQKRLKEEDRIRSSYTVCELCPFSDFKQKVSVIANVATGEVICLEVLKPDTRDNVVTDRLDSVIKRQIVIQGILIFAQENDAELYVRAMEDEGLVSKSTQESEKTLVVCEVEAGDVRFHGIESKSTHHLRIILLSLYKFIVLHVHNVFAGECIYSFFGNIYFVGRRPR